MNGVADFISHYRPMPGEYERSIFKVRDLSNGALRNKMAIILKMTIII
jgi:hypothetical protein